MKNLFSIHPLKYSLIYVFYLIFVHFYAYICAMMMIPVWLDVPAFFCLIVSFLYFLGSAQAAGCLVYSGKTDWLFYSESGAAVQMQLQPSSVVMRYFLVLHFAIKVEEKRLAQGKLKNRLMQVFSKHSVKTFVLFSDMFSEEDYRHLRRCMKMGFF